ncbi:ergothioneine biosynthesis protein EgtB [Planctomycetota bacterium]
MKRTVREHCDSELADAFSRTRRFTERIVEPLSAEDCMVQSMEDVSPTRWHLAHTTWFFETFALQNQPGYQVFNEHFNYLFNSYYNTIGSQFPRPQRGLLSRPGLDEIKRYRQHVDDAIAELLKSPDYLEQMQSVLEIGIQHEQQHQELMLTDIKHVFSCNPMYPAYREYHFDTTCDFPDGSIEIPAQLYSVGNDGDAFAFDNELPTHQVYVNECRLSKQLVTCGEYLQFMEDGGYERPELWLSLGWNTVQQKRWTAPLYWVRRDNVWMQFTLAGLVPVDPSWPVCHISLFEADAFARWCGRRLPTEFEWEVASQLAGSGANVGNVRSQPFADVLFEREWTIHPTRSPESLMGAVWQWTSSSYQAYPGYKAPAGAIGEYNGKFMCNQYVLRGGSVATDSRHIRPTYRNFFPADTRWQFTGVRLAD